MIIKTAAAFITTIGLILVIFFAFGLPAILRYQVRADHQNKIITNELKIQQIEQLVKIKQQEALARVEEAKGTAASQEIINEILTDRYLQNEAIQAQLQMASPPIGTNGIPLVKTKVKLIK